MVKITNIPFDELIPSELTVDNWKDWLKSYPRTDEELTIEDYEPLRKVDKEFVEYSIKKFVKAFSELPTDTQIIIMDKIKEDSK